MRREFLNGPDGISSSQQMVASLLGLSLRLANEFAGEICQGPVIELQKVIGFFHDARQRVECVKPVDIRHQEHFHVIPANVVVVPVGRDFFSNDRPHHFHALAAGGFAGVGVEVVRFIARDLRAGPLRHDFPPCVSHDVGGNVWFILFSGVSVGHFEGGERDDVRHIAEPIDAFVLQAEQELAPADQKVLLCAQDGTQRIGDRGVLPQASLRHRHGPAAG